MFPQYKRLNSIFYEKYGSYSSYPYAMLVLEKILRMGLVGKIDLVNRDYSYYSKFYFSRALVRWLSYPLAILLSFLSNKKKVVFRIHKFEDLSKELYSKFCQEQYLCYSNPFLVKVLLSHVVCGNLKLTKALKKNHKTIFSGAVDEKAIKELNIFARKEVVFYSKIFSILNIKHILVLGDSSAAERIICEAAKMSGCQVTVFAHGYAQSPSLITLAPVYADSLFVWTEKQKKDLLQVVENSSGKKIHYNGCFFKKKSAVKEECPVALIGLEPLPSLPDEMDYYIRIINSYVNILLVNKFQVLIRPHPKEKNIKAIFDLIGDKNNNVAVSDEKDALKAISGCSLFLSANSSMLIQADVIGKISFQISELKKFSFEDIKPVQVCQVIEEYSKATELHDKPSGISFFNSDKFINEKDYQ